MDCHGFRVFCFARLLARSLFRGSRWQFLPGVCQTAPEKTLSAHLAPLPWRSGLRLQLRLQVEDGHRRHSRHAPHRAVYRTGRRRNPLAPQLELGPPPLQNVALSTSCRAYHDRLGLALLADGFRTKMGPGGNCAWRVCISHSRARSATMAFCKSSRTGGCVKVLVQGVFRSALLGGALASIFLVPATSQFPPAPG